MAVYLGRTLTRAAGPYADVASRRRGAVLDSRSLLCAEKKVSWRPTPTPCPWTMFGGMIFGGGRKIVLDWKPISSALAFTCDPPLGSKRGLRCWRPAYV